MRTRGKVMSWKVKGLAVGCKCDQKRVVWEAGRVAGKLEWGGHLSDCAGITALNWHSHHRVRVSILQGQNPTFLGSSIPPGPRSRQNVPFLCLYLWYWSIVARRLRKDCLRDGPRSLCAKQNNSNPRAGRILHLSVCLAEREDLSRVYVSRINNPVRVEYQCEPVVL